MSGIAPWTGGMSGDGRRAGRKRRFAVVVARHLERDWSMPTKFTIRPEHFRHPFASKCRISWFEPPDACEGLHCQRLTSLTGEWYVRGLPSDETDKQYSSTVGHFFADRQYSPSGGDFFHAHWVVAGEEPLAAPRYYVIEAH